MTRLPDYPIIEFDGAYNVDSMRIVILAARTGWHTDELVRALVERGHTASVRPYEGLVAQLGATTHSNGLSSERSSLLDADGVLVRIVPNGSLEQIIYRLDALHWVEQRGVPIMNSPRAVERSVDKFYTTALLQDAGLPTPETVVCEGADEAMVAVRRMGDVIIKPLFGSMGHGMVRVSDPEIGFRVVRALEQLRSVFYVQRAIDHGGRDIRVFVVGGRVLGAIERRAPAGDWRTNVSNGGSAQPFALPPGWADLSVRAAKAVGADYAGVDLLQSTDGQLFLLEVNGIPGWQGLQQATGIDVAAAIVDEMLTRGNVERGCRQI
jgi:RimK family alpha-L-glutamate ligase